MFGGHRTKRTADDTQWVANKICNMGLWEDVEKEKLA